MGVVVTGSSTILFARPRLLNGYKEKLQHFVPNLPRCTTTTATIKAYPTATSWRKEDEGGGDNEDTEVGQLV